MRRRLFIMQFRNAAPSAFAMLVSIVLVLHLVERMLLRGPLRSDPAGAAQYTSVFVLAVVFLSAYAGGIGTFGKAYKERTSHFIQSIPVPRAQAWAVCVSAQLAVLLSACACVVLLRCATSPAARASMTWVLDAEGLPPAGSLLLIWFTVFAWGACFAFGTQNSLINGAIGVCVGVATLCAHLLWCLHFDMMGTGFSGSARFGSETLVVVGAVLVAALALSSRLFCRGQSRLLRTKVRNLAEAAFCFPALVLVASPLGFHSDVLCRPWGERYAEPVDGGKAIIVAEEKERHPWRVRFRVTEVSTGRCMGAAEFGGVRSSSRAEVNRPPPVAVAGADDGFYVVHRDPGLREVLRALLAEAGLGKAEVWADCPRRIRRLDLAGKTVWVRPAPAMDFWVAMHDGSLLFAASADGGSALCVADRAGAVSEIATVPGDGWPWIRLTARGAVVLSQGYGRQPVGYRVDRGRATPLEVKPAEGKYRSVGILDGVVHLGPSSIARAALPEDPSSLCSSGRLRYLIGRGHLVEYPLALSEEAGEGVLFARDLSGRWREVQDGVVAGSRARSREKDDGLTTQWGPGLSRSELGDLVCTAVRVEDRVGFRLHDLRTEQSFVLDGVEFPSPDDLANGVVRSQGDFGVLWIPAEQGWSPFVYRRGVGVRRSPGRPVYWGADGVLTYWEDDKIMATDRSGRTWRVY